MSTHRVSTMSRPPIHPGEILSDELEALGIDFAAFAHAIKLAPHDVNQLICGQHDVTECISQCLAQWFGTSVQFWLNLQISYNNRVENENIKIG